MKVKFLVDTWDHTVNQTITKGTVRADLPESFTDQCLLYDWAEEVKDDAKVNVKSPEKPSDK